MSELIKVDYQGKRVLTTQQLAEVYKTDIKNISNNFNRNQERFTENKDYYLLDGEELQAFKGIHPEDENLKFVSKLYLWTSRGANRHCKILDTDQAWQQFDLLEETYFQVKTGQSVLPSMTQTQLIAAIAQQSAEQEQKLIALETRTEDVENRLTIVKDTLIQRDDNWRENINLMVNKIVKNTINKDYSAVRTESYQMLEERAHCDINARLRNLKTRMTECGATKSKINATTKMDVIELEPRLKEIYTSIIKELTIKHVI
jgi:hypothetical protein